MAEGLPYAIGAAVAYPDRQVVAIVGDGGFTMLMGEIATLVKYNLPIKVIIIKNNVLGADQVGADGAGGQSRVRRRAAADRLRRLCAGLRRRRLHARRSSEGGAVMREAFAQPGPALSRRLWMPTSRRCLARSRTKQAIHFAEALVKGEKDRVDIVKDVLADKVREVV